MNSLDFKGIQCTGKYTGIVRDASGRDMGIWTTLRLGDETWFYLVGFNMWLQPIWKICKSQIGFPEAPSFGMNISKNIWNQPRPSKKVQVFSQPTGFAGLKPKLREFERYERSYARQNPVTVHGTGIFSYMDDFYGKCMVKIYQSHGSYVQASSKGFFLVSFVVSPSFGVIFVVTNIQAWNLCIKANTQFVRGLKHKGEQYQALSSLSCVFCSWMNLTTSVTPNFKWMNSHISEFTSITKKKKAKDTNTQTLHVWNICLHLA